MNQMRTIRIEKLTLNIGAGKSTERLDKGIKLIKNLTGITPVKTITNKRIAAWGLRPGLPIGCKLTLRKNAAAGMLKRLLAAKENKLRQSQFDDLGNISFGIKEYIDIPDASYDPDIGIMGFEACITLERPGFRIKRRKIAQKKLPHKHKISKQEAIDYMASAFQVQVVEE